MPPIRIALLGAGCVGSGVYDLIHYKLADPSRFLITHLVVRDTSKQRPFTVDTSVTTLTSELSSVLADPDIDVVIEVVGGSTGPIADGVYSSLTSGKHVITANKALIAENLPHLSTLLSNLPNTSTNFYYEAAVCGGIPIINALATAYPLDTITSVTGICNGTTNFILSAMSNGGSYATVLKQAQDVGFAEADPTADVEGHDARAKIIIMARLAFGVTASIHDVETTGITTLSEVDFEYANLLGMTIKLLACARRNRNLEEFDGPLSVYVSPHMVPKDSLFAKTEGGNNAVIVESKNLGTSQFTGPGAGRFETANSVVADLLRVEASVKSNATVAPNPFPKRMTKDDEGTELDADFAGTFYIRITISDGLGIVARVGAIAAEQGVFIDQILQNRIVDRSECSFVVMTEECQWSEVKGMKKEILEEPWAKNVLAMPVYEGK